MDTKNLHDPRYLIPWEIWDDCKIESCRFFSINSMILSIDLNHIGISPASSSTLSAYFGVLDMYRRESAQTRSTLQPKSPHS